MKSRSCYAIWLSLLLLIPFLSNTRVNDDGKTLYLKVLGPDNIVMKTWSTAPTNSYNAENPGTIMVEFECGLPANTKETFEVLLVPWKSKEAAEFLNMSLYKW